MSKKMIQIEKNDLINLVYWARRYCDGKNTYSPHCFNLIYKKLKSLHPDVFTADRFDESLKDQGSYWPYAQDVTYDPVNNVGWNAKPFSFQKNSK